MSELLEKKERKLWFEGPNYTADAIVIDPDTDMILLIQRKDTGDWALPGGFIDDDDRSPEDSARREAREESTLVLTEPGELVYRGIVDDPRNSEDAWIETSAYLFTGSSSDEVRGTDDAQKAAWFPIAELPQLYASHQAIVERALDYRNGRRLIDSITTEIEPVAVDGGHMQYDKFILESGENDPIFCKRFDPTMFTDDEKATHSYSYLEKEAALMHYLRTTGYSAIPDRSILHRSTLMMSGLTPKDGWHWRVPNDKLDDYISSCLEAFSALESTPTHPDTFDIEPSMKSFREEGWQALANQPLDDVRDSLKHFLPRLDEPTRLIAEKLLGTLPDCLQASLNVTPPTEYVLCHHDIRQSNIAWHPEHGSKLIDWSWAGLGVPGSDITSLLIDLHKSGNDVSAYKDLINKDHCLRLIGFWLGHSLWPDQGNGYVRLQQFLSAVNAHELLEQLD